MRTRTGAQPGFDYQVLRNNGQWEDHVQRSRETAQLVSRHVQPWSVLDPAAGDGSFELDLAARLRDPVGEWILSDISAPNVGFLRDRFPAADVRCEDLFEALSREQDQVELVVLTEVLEHLEDPDRALELARGVGTWLVASSPETRPGQVDTNPEHLWQFDEEGYAEMLKAAGWEPVECFHLRFPANYYDFQLWVCR